METTATLNIPIAISESALRALERIQVQANDAQKKIRIGVKGGGCSGLTYVLENDEPTANDQTYMVGNVEIMVNKAHELYLTGMTLDFEDGLNNRGFVFNNPNAKQTCGCGTSFSI